MGIFIPPKQLEFIINNSCNLLVNIKRVIINNVKTEGLKFMGEIVMNYSFLKILQTITNRGLHLLKRSFYHLFL